MNDTKTKLEIIEKEISELKQKEAELKEKWLLEKSIIQNIQELKTKIEQIKIQADNYERSGELEKVAEIRYGKLYNLQKQLKEATEKLNNLQSNNSLLKEEVNEEIIAQIVSKWTGIPVSKMLETERLKMLNMENRLHNRVVGQKVAVELVSNSIRRSRAGLQDQNRPIGSFLFIGPTGVGKTELAKSLAEFLFDDENAVVRIDMSEYMEKFSVSRLIGAPPGYVGYEEGGQLTEAVRRRPYSVILLDEIEKAHSDVFNILLQVLDDGRLTDSKGRMVNFKNTIIIMTSNFGTDLIQQRFATVNEEEYDEIYSSVQNEIFDLLRKQFRPEFLNRIDEIVLFKPLTKEEIKSIAKIQLEKLINKLKQNKIEIVIENEVFEKIAEIGYDPNFGARPLKRVIQKSIIDHLATSILSNNINEGDVVHIVVNKNGTFDFIKNQ